MAYVPIPKDLTKVRQKLILNLVVNQDYTLEQGLIADKEEFFNEVFSIQPVLKVKRQM